MLKEPREDIAYTYMNIAYYYREPKLSHWLTTLYKYTTIIDSYFPTFTDHLIQLC